jgi:hypothetical protein
MRLAQSKFDIAYGDARQNNRPTFAFGGEYNRYAKFNNYSRVLPALSAQQLQRRNPDHHAGLRRHPQGQGQGLKCGGPAGNCSSRSIARPGRGTDPAIAEEHGSNLQRRNRWRNCRTNWPRINSTRSPRSFAWAAVLEELQPLPKDEQAARINERSRFVDTLEARFELTQARLSLFCDRWGESKTGPRKCLPPRP